MSRTQPTSDEGMRARLALAIVVMVSGCLTVLLFWDVPSLNRELLSAALGALLMRLADVYSYSFGSSANHDRQAETLHAVAQTAKAAQAAAAPEPTIPVEPGERVTVEGKSE